MLSFGGARSGRDLNCQSALTVVKFMTTKASESKRAMGGILLPGVKKQLDFSPAMNLVRLSLLSPMLVENES
jgi:hypothetical protein